MIVLDSMTIAVPSNLVEVTDSCFSHTFDSGGNLLRKVTKSNILGFNAIEVKPDITRIDVSAKIILEQYKDGININTIGRVLDTINATGIIRLKSNTLTDYKVHKCDFVANFHTNKPHQDYYNALNLIYNPRYTNAMYEKISKNGFAFIGKQSGSNKYMKFYDKEKELYRSCNKPFVKIVGMPNLMNDFKDVIRIEYRAITHEQIRIYSEINSNDLDSLLRGVGNPLYKVFCEILRGNSIKHDDLALLGNIRTIQELDYMLGNVGYTFWLNMFGNDLNNALSPIRQMLKLSEKYKSSTSRKLKYYKEKFQQLLSFEMATISDNNVTDSIDEIKRFLLTLPTIVDNSPRIDID